MKSYHLKVHDVDLKRTFESRERSSFTDFVFMTE